MPKGTCTKRKKFYGFVTLSEKGQLAIPIELRRDLAIDRGDRLLILKRKDGKGFNLIKGNEVEDFMDSLAGE